MDGHSTFDLPLEEIVDRLLALGDALVPTDGKKPDYCRLHPACSQFEGSTRNATRSRGLILDAMSHHPELVVASVAGPRSLRIDLDGTVAMDRMRAACGDDVFDRNVTVYTNPERTHAHVYVTVPEGVTWRRPTGWSGCDVRRPGGAQLVSPWQTRPDGKHYALDRDALRSAPPRDPRIEAVFDVSTDLHDALGRGDGTSTKRMSHFLPEAVECPPEGDSAVERFLSRVEANHRRGGWATKEDGTPNRSGLFHGAVRSGAAEGLTAPAIVETLRSYSSSLSGGLGAYVTERPVTALLADAEDTLRQTAPRGHRASDGTASFHSAARAHAAVDALDLPRPSYGVVLHAVVDAFHRVATHSGRDADGFGVLRIDLGVDQLAGLIGKSRASAARALLTLEAAGVLTLAEYHRHGYAPGIEARVRGWVLLGVGAPVTARPSRTTALDEAAREARARQAVRRDSAAAVARANAAPTASRRTKRTDLDDIEHYGLGTSEGDAAYERVHGVRPEAHAAGGLYRRRAIH